MSAKKTQTNKNESQEAFEKAGEPTREAWKAMGAQVSLVDALSMIFHHLHALISNVEPYVVKHIKLI